MKTSSISVIVPVYKVEQYLRECLDSLINQTFQDWQAICVDDGSPDNCGKILDEYARKDGRFMTIHKVNGGLSSARNAAYEYINTPYVMFLDSDDFLHNRALELAYNKIEETKADILWFDYNYFNDGEIIKQKDIIEEPKVKVYKNPLEFYALKKGLLVSHKDRMLGMVNGKLYKSKYVKETLFAQGIAPGEDNLFTFEITSKVSVLAHLKEKLYFYRQRQTSIMHTLETEKLKINMQKEMDWYMKMRNRLVEQNVSIKNVSIYDKYIAERVFFKKFFRPFIKGAKGCQSKEYIDNLINLGIFDFNKMRAKYRFALFLYSINQVKLCKVFSYM